MSMGLPILNIHSIDEDLCVKTLHEYPASLSLLETKKITDKMINQVCDFFLDRPQVSPLVINNILKDYKTKVIADKYLIMLK